MTGRQKAVVASPRPSFWVCWKERMGWEWMEAGKVKRLSGLDGAGVEPKGFQITRLLSEQAERIGPSAGPGQITRLLLDLQWVLAKTLGSYMTGVLMFAFLRFRLGTIQSKPSIWVRGPTPLPLPCPPVPATPTPTLSKS